MKIEIVNVPTKFLSAGDWKVPCSLVERFFDDAQDHINDIGKPDDYSDGYLYFDSNEKQLEQILLHHKVITPKLGRFSASRVEKYKLTVNYHRFVTMYYDLFDS